MPVRKRATSAADSAEPYSETSETEYSEWEKRDTGSSPRGKTFSKKIRQPPTIAESNKYATMLVRCKATFFMVTGFVFMVLAGHSYCAFLVLLLSMAIFREIIHLKRNKEKDNKLPFFYALRWYFLGVTILYVSRLFLGERIERMALRSRFVEGLFVTYHSFLCYIGCVFGIVFFVLSLRKFTLRYQFHQFGWTMLTLLLVVVQACAQVANIYQGLIWFILPTSLVIVNDSAAYFVGIFFGRTPLIALSPKKTVEGFVGGSIFTILWAVVFMWFIQKFHVFLCPQREIDFIPFGMYSQVVCASKDLAIFQIATEYTLPSALTGLFTSSPVSIWLTEMQIHGCFLSAFASLIAPFGGFFASGFKRAFKIKDFGDSIPGHGGVTDRFDCQILMGMFTYIYLYSFVLVNKKMSVSGIIHSVLQLPDTEQAEVLRLLQEALQLKGVA